MTSRRVIIACLCLMIASCGTSRWQDTPQTHIVRRGETLFSIAWRYDKNPTDLARWNRLGDGSLIYPGQVIRLTPTGAASSPRTAGNRAPPQRDSRPLPHIPAQPAPEWSWPTSGRINVDFRAKPGPGTGVLINGTMGQPISAAASGRVVYAGDGLIGYGKLIILKHNDTYLSAYGYNASLLVKEGEQINKGQRIASMGEGPERKPRLHFEIRRNGQPVDPRQQLPPR
ncbi:MAG: peptidoglycan DD-metalloendopeptidase family protein [Gammaproteobacteria bacterium]|nr:peptidoglycan DD-metalloendopeptidase family protein [Gammaproteobacteria bacterium]MBT8109936.1 peptidoglycan DD-metalloendopeptidase family protein [Gammaproteobacteria bacterium]NND47566.1 peptidoglycan DD-metalloendopeptidase family protein [Woeseiaceae bacterium]NNL44638.1 peptidoglycan DD-metalloendopeptidase family protein [Woeseiaceae bacterium]